MVSCPKCGAKVDEDSQFCPKCGGKIPPKEEPKKEHKKEAKTEKKSINKIVTIISIILVISAIVVFAIPISYEATEEYLENVPYTDTEYYTENEPYESTESYQDTEQYTDKECSDIQITKNIKWGQTQSSCVDTDCTSYNQVCVKTNWLGNCLEYQDVCQSVTCTRYTLTCNVIIKNLDNAGGTFSFDGYYVTKDGKDHFVKQLSQYLQPGDEESFTWIYTLDKSDFGNCKYANFITPKKKECENIIKSRTITKTRPVTRYRDVQQSRTVTKYKDEVKTRKVTRTTTLYKIWAGQTEWYYKTY